MRKIFAIALCLCLIGSSACKKNDDASGGYWTFRSQTYHSQFANWVQGSLLSYTGTSYPTGSISLTFYDAPSQSKTTSPTLTQYIASNNNSAGQGSNVYIILTDTSATSVYHPSPSNVAAVTVAKSGNNYTVTIPPIMMIRDTGKDSALLSGKVIQIP